MSVERHYWKCNRSMSASIRELWWEDNEIRKSWKALAKSINSSGAVVGEGWGRVYCAGFTFETEPNPKLFYRHKKQCRIWVPRAGTKLRDQMDSQVSRFYGKLCDLIKFQPLTGFGYVTPGVRAKERSIYIELVGPHPKSDGLLRISQATFQKHFGKGN